MKGIELSERFYEAYGRPMIREQFPEYEERIAVGLVGHGSECFGYDDDVSSDHDYGPEFCLFLTEEDHREIGFRLERAYDKLPASFEGIARSGGSRFGAGTKGVHAIAELYRG